MFKKMPIRLRLAIMTTALLAICCTGLTLILNSSAYKMASKIYPSHLTPSITEPSNEPINTTPKLPMDNGIDLEPYSAFNTEKAKTDFSAESIVYMLLVILGGGFLTYYISGKALRPLDILNDKIKNINEHNLAEALEVPSTKDEISELTESFNTMTNKLDYAFMMQRRFSASAAHELRTPLAVLKSKIAVFKKKGNHTTEDYDALIGVFEKQTNRLSELVVNLLDMTNMDDDYEKSNISASDIFYDIISEFSAIAKERNITLSLNCDHSVLVGNIDLLYRAFYNLVENAIKYNIEHGRVEIIVKELNPGEISVEINDTGIGIPDDMKKNVFEPFFRVDKSRSRQLGGAGLGLSIVDTIIQKHNGTISIHNGKDGGTSVKILLKI